MSKQSRRTIISSLLILLFTLALIEFGLRTFDILGIRYFDDLSTVYTVWQPHDDGYTFPDGTYHLSNYSFTFRDGMRQTPDTNGNGETVYFVGDSGTFGMGVNDHETWVNHVARGLQINAINLGLPGYNIGNIERRLSHLPQDTCIVWLIIDNDHEPDAAYKPFKPPPPQAYITRYLTFLAPRQTAAIPDDVFYQRVTDALSDERVTAAVFEGAFADGLPETVHRIPRYTRRISYVDPHPSAVGNVEIADAMTPIVRDVIETRDCRG